MKEVLDTHSVDMNQIRCESPLESRYLLPRRHQMVDASVAQIISEWKTVNGNSVVLRFIRHFRMGLRRDDDVFIAALSQSGKQLGGEDLDAADVGPESPRPK